VNLNQFLFEVVQVNIWQLGAVDVFFPAPPKFPFATHYPGKELFPDWVDSQDICI